MSVVDYIENLYENSIMGSLDFELSEYLLMHIFEIESMSLKDLSDAIGISKSTISTYFDAPAIPSGFVAFKRALNAEIGNSELKLQVQLKWLDRLEKKTKAYVPLSENDIELLCRKILASGKVIFTGSKRYRDSLMTLISLLRFYGIRSRYVIDTCLQENEKELLTMDKDDLLIFLIPYSTYSRYHFTICFIPKYAKAYKECTGNKIYLCKPDGVNDGVEKIAFHASRNPHESVLNMTSLSVKMFKKCVEISNTNTDKTIYII